MADYLKTLTSFSGADLIVNFGPRVIGELQQISWGIERQKAPVYTLGSPDPRSFSRGKRGIAGSLVFAQFDRDALLDELQKVWEEIAPPAMFTAAGNLALAKADDFESLIDLAAWDETSSAAAKKGISTTTGSDGRSQINVPPGFGVITKEHILYADMLPPVDVTMTFANEYGQAAFQKIYYLEFLNEGSGVSVDTVVQERQMTWIARRISPLYKGIYSVEKGNIDPKKVIV